MWHWISENASLWGFIALPLAVIMGLPAFAQLLLTLRDSGKSTSALHETLRNTQGRVHPQSLQNAAIGTTNVLPIRVLDSHGDSHDAVHSVYETVRLGASVLIVGTAGSGKTQLLRDIHEASYREAHKPSDPLIEVVPLSSYTKNARKGLNLWAWTSKLLANRYRVSIQAMEALMSEAKLLPAFDGLDEVELGKREQVALELESLARSRPIIVASRPPKGSQNDSTLLDTLTIIGGLRHFEIRPLDWPLVETEMQSSGIETSKTLGKRARVRLCNPLTMQALLFLWKSKRLNPQEMTAVLHEPSRLWSRFMSPLYDSPTTDPALRLAGLLIADLAKDSSGAFKAYPVQLSGQAVRWAKAIVWVAASYWCVLHELWVTWPVFTLALASASPRQTATLLGRAISGWTGRQAITFWSWLREFLVLVLAAFAVVHACRIISWSIQSKSLDIGDWSTLLPEVWVAPTAGFILYALNPPMPVRRSVYVWGSYMEQHAWPHFIVLALLVWGSLFAIPWTAATTLWAVGYAGLACAYLIVSATICWQVVGQPPWCWNRLLSELVRRGILCRDGERYKFTHARVRQRVLWELAQDGRTPTLYWTSFDEDWYEPFFDGDASMLVEQKGQHFDDAVRLLARRNWWSIYSIEASVCYFQWWALKPEAALSLLRRHVHHTPFSLVRPLLADAYDRLNDPRGSDLARRLLGKRLQTTVQLHWALRVVARNEDDATMVRRIQGLLPLYTDYPDIESYLASRLALHRCAADMAPDCGYPPPGQALQDADLVVASLCALRAQNIDPGQMRSLAAILSESRDSLLLARAAQMLKVLGEDVCARDMAEESFEALTTFEGYGTMLEVMLTTAMLSQPASAVSWLDRAHDAGLRLRGRSDLWRSLAIEEGRSCAGLFSEREVDDRGADAILPDRSISPN